MKWDEMQCDEVVWSIDFEIWGFRGQLSVGACVPAHVPAVSVAAAHVLALFFASHFALS